MRKILALALLLQPLTCIAQPSEESPIKFAFYSPSWGSGSDLNLLAGLRLVVDNQTNSPIELQRIEFPADVDDKVNVQVEIGLDIPAGRLAEKELPYADLLTLNACVDKTLQGSWRLVEISNYTLNPSVRRFIIEDTSAFRIYQCVSRVVTTWMNLTNRELISREEWILYHFESRPEG